MDPSDNNISCNKPEVVFERRQNATSDVHFPIVDSSGNTITKERRLDASIYLSKIEIAESRLSEDEFTSLFKQ